MQRSTGTRSSVLVIGAGAAGLGAAGRIAPWADVVVVDKGRGVGGRLATRRIGDATFDHGAQFVTTHGEPFRSFVAGLSRDGVVQPWFSGPVGPQGSVTTSGATHVRWRGTRGMTSVAKHLAQGLDVRCGQRVQALRSTDDGWLVELGGPDGSLQVLGADGVVVTAPVPQSLELIQRGGVELARRDAVELGSIVYDPCLAVLAPLEEAWCLPGPGAIRPDDPALAWAADNAAKGVSGRPALTLHATSAMSRSMWSAPDDAVIDRLLGAVTGAMGGRPPEVDTAAVQVQRWRYSVPTSVHPDPCIEASDLPPLVFAGDAFGGPRVEGAVVSGWAAAAALQRRLGEDVPAQD